MKSLNKQEFKEMLAQDKPVVVDFWASWCMPCKMLAPIFEELAEFYGNRVKLVKVSTEEEPEIAQEYEIRGIPSIIIFNKGKEVQRITGLMPKEQLKQKIDSVVDNL